MIGSGGIAIEALPVSLRSAGVGIDFPPIVETFVLGREAAVLPGALARAIQTVTEECCQRPPSLPTEYPTCR